MKRARPAASQPTQRVIIDVGGTKLTTTTTTIMRSSYLAGMIDLDAWSSDADHCAEIFLDRDPEIFAQLLRLMRQQPHIAGLLPSDPQQCASVITEADFFGFEGLLTHVKVQTYFNSREPKDDHPKYINPAVNGLSLPERRERRIGAMRQHNRECAQIDALFEANDEAHALSRFDAVYGDVGAALRSGVLPSYFLDRKPPKPQPVKKLLQVMPVDATTWFLVGLVDDPKYGYNPDDLTRMHKMELVVLQPGRVRRVACQALVEDEKGHRWLEPMVNLSATDLEELMNDEQLNFEDGLWYGNNIVVDTGLTSFTGGPARRTILASDWMEMVPSMPLDKLWTHLLMAETPPREFGFEY